MPVPAQIRGEFRDHHQVANTGGNLATAARAAVYLACLIGLDRFYDERTER